MMKISNLSSHILDSTKGKPAQNVKVHLYKVGDGEKKQYIAENITDEDGRIKSFSNEKLAIGHYQLVFYVNSYFALQKQASLYPLITIDFLIDDENAHYHIPLLLSPYGYSTYRGS